jgi:hypothetical protein
VVIKICQPQSLQHYRNRPFDCHRGPTTVAASWLKPLEYQ